MTATAIPLGEVETAGCARCGAAVAGGGVRVLLTVRAPSPQRLERTLCAVCADALVECFSETVAEVARPARAAR